MYEKSPKWFWDVSANCFINLQNIIDGTAKLGKMKCTGNWTLELHDNLKTEMFVELEAEVFSRICIMWIPITKWKMQKVKKFVHESKISIVGSYENGEKT